MISTLLLCWLAAANVARKAPAGWDVLFELPPGADVFTSVWIKDERSWRAGGTNFMIAGDGARISKTEVPGYDVYAFAMDAAGNIVAAGSNQAIWEDRNGRFVLVRQKAGPRLKGRAARGDALEEFGYLDPLHPQRLIAYGLGAVVAQDGPNDQWQSLDDPTVLNRAKYGPKLTPPPGCHLAEWLWLSRDRGLFGCHEGVGYLWSQSELTPLGQLPRHCGPALTDASLDENQLVLGCFDPAGIWSRTLPAGRWARTLGDIEIRAMDAHFGCILVATRHQVLRRCPPPSAAVHEAPPRTRPNPQPR